MPQRSSAQVVEVGDNAPAISTFDANGVDLQSGKLSVSLLTLGVGDGSAGALSYSLDTSDSGSNLTAGSVQPDNVNPALYNVHALGSSDRFKLTGALSTGSFANFNGTQATLTYNAATSVFTYTASNGVIAHFTVKLGSGAPDNPIALITDATFPSGEKIKWKYALAPDASHYDWMTVASNLGYQVRVTRAATANYGWAVTGVVAFNMASETCDPVAASCTLAGTWPKYTIAYSGTQITATDNIARTTTSTTTTTTPDFTSTLTSPQGRQTVYGYHSTGSAGPPVYNQVRTIERAGRTWTYGTANVYHPSITQPNGGSVAVASRLLQDIIWEGDNGRLLQIMEGGDLGNAINHVSVQYQSVSGILTGRSASIYEGAGVSVTLDSYGNVKTKSVVTPYGDPPLTTTFDYPTDCSNLVTCHRPLYAIDPNLHRTDYTYDQVHGGVLSILAPADVNGVRPSTRYTYAQYAAQYRDGSGATISGTPVYKLATASVCQTLATCAGTADEVRTVYDYDTQNALLLKSVTVQTGTGTVLSSISRTYYPTGDLKTEDGPLVGAADTTRFYYDGARQLLGVIGPDPDGAGPLPRRATRITRDLDGLVTLQEQGTATDQSDTGMTTFTPWVAQAYAYDARGDLVEVRQKAGATTYSVTQITKDYTSTGSYVCVAVRMNPAVFASLPSSACTLGTTGSAGPDRITKTVYDLVDRVSSVTTGLGTADETADQRYTYTGLTKVELLDALNNKTTFTSDNYLRLYKTQYPSPTRGAGTSSTTDYEQLTLDGVGNVTSRRLRDNQVIGYTYDGLNRLTLKNLPSTEPDVSYAYDLLSRPTSMTQPGMTLTMSYDPLGRLLTATQPYGSMSYQYDPAGRRVQTTWQDGFYVTYDRLVTGEVTWIRENGATSGAGVLASYGYDGLGRRTLLVRGNGTTTSYGYDAVSRLSSLSHDLAGTSYDVTLGYSPNAAGQTGSVSRSNDAYVWTQGVAVNRPYTANGLNQLTTAGATALGYDARGNLTSSGGTTYSYSSENLLKGSNLGVTLTYDPAVRLVQYDAPASTRFVYDGGEIAEEISNPSGAVLRRYVSGPGDDEPLVWYEGSGTTDRRWLYADERGSVVAYTNDIGAAIAIDSYDEFGIPASTMTTAPRPSGRFGYTGQAWLPELGLAYYKARLYSPTLGRFMQTDPIGYADGVNWYAYVGNDPVNGRDPSGNGGERVYHGNDGTHYAPPPASPPSSYDFQYGIGAIANGGASAAPAQMPAVNNVTKVAPQSRPYQVSIRTTGRSWMDSHAWIEWKHNGKTRSVGLTPHANGPQKPGVQFNVELDRNAYPVLASRTLNLTSGQFNRMAQYVMGAVGDNLQWSEMCTCAHFAEGAWLAGTGENLDTWGYEDPGAVTDSINRLNGGR